MFELETDARQNAVIKVIGVGGGGGNAVSHMLRNHIEGVEFIVANTDAQALKNLGVSTTIQLGTDITKGLGAGANPDIGRSSALEDKEAISDILQDADMVFITAGMGGGTGTGAAPIVAQIAKELGILTVAVVTKPFPFEGERRMALAEQGLKELADSVDSLIVIPNAKLLSVLGKDSSLLSAFGAANDVLLGAVQGIADLITRPGMINVDFADVKTVMSEMGMAMMGTGYGSGSSRAVEAAEAAIRSPLLDEIDLNGACGVLVNITAGLDFSIGEFNSIGEIIKQFSSSNATVVIGTVIDADMNEEIRVTVVATGLQSISAGASNTQDTMKTPITSSPSEVNAPVTPLIKPTATPSQQPILTPTSQLTASEDKTPVSSEKKETNEDVPYLDIPAFLRRNTNPVE